MPSLPGRLQGVWARSIYRSRPVPPGNGGIFPAAGAAGRSLELLYRLPFPPKEIEAAIRRYRAAGMPMVEHSTAYRQAFSPAYRVVLQSDAALLPLLAAIDRSRRERPRTLAAIDGPCATGKSTLGARLSQLYGCPLFHMDDFFLLPERKTPERLAQPGGNVDYERFFAQVLAPLSRGEPVLYQPYRCHSGALAAARTIPPPPWLWWRGFTPCARNFNLCIRSNASSALPGRSGRPVCWSGVSGGAGALPDPLDPAGGPLFSGVFHFRRLRYPP